MKRPTDVLVFDPYLTTLGGGEQVIFSVAEAWRSAGASPTIAAPELPDKVALHRFGLDLGLPLKHVDLGALSEVSAHYDALVYLTNSLPVPSSARRSYLIVQFPFEQLATWRHPRRRYRQLKILRGYQTIVYSEYVRRWLRRRWKQHARVLAPAVSQGRYEPQQKKPVILSVGRFFGVDHSKRQDVLIEAFKRLPPSIRQEWRLILAGGVKPADQDYVQSLRRAAEGFPVEFVVNAQHERLQQLYGEASFFWHATGYGRDGAAPEKAEHFGMTTVEAMSYGCVPLAYADGGQVEIIKPSFGTLWRSLTELVAETLYLMKNPDICQERAVLAASAASGYDATAFRIRCAEVFGIKG